MFIQIITWELSLTTFYLGAAASSGWLLGNNSEQKKKNVQQVIPPKLKIVIFTFFCTDCRDSLDLWKWGCIRYLSIVSLSVCVAHAWRSSWNTNVGSKAMYSCGTADNRILAKNKIFTFIISGVRSNLNISLFTLSSLCPFQQRKKERSH